jgi:calcineurin-like phosphoesterase family protein
MSEVWFTSDTHFCHARVAELRGFASVADHDESLIASWNATVKPGDVVWHLGDVGMGHESDVLAKVWRLNGVKHLVAGNHDPCWPRTRDARRHQRKWLDAFESVQAYAKVRFGPRTILLSHFPYDGDHTFEERHVQYRLRNEGEWLAHGHTHAAEQTDGPRSVHVGLDAWGLRPASRAEILALMTTMEG